MKRIVFSICILFSFCLFGQDKDVADANTLYAKGNYMEAIKIYEGILKTSESYELYYNLGNAYFKAGNIPFAILNYERAKKLKPNDDDLLYNLQLANNKIPDRQETPGKLFYQEWYEDLLNLFSEKGWSLLCILLLIVALLLLVLYINASNPGYKKITFWSGAVFLLLAVNSFFFARAQYKNEVTHNEAIIVLSSATVKGSPSDKGTRLFILHEGTKVKIDETIEGWTKIVLPGKKVGWIPSNSFVTI